MIVLQVYELLRCRYDTLCCVDRTGFLDGIHLYKSVTLGVVLFFCT
jgi:hypothetical protein